MSATTSPTFQGEPFARAPVRARPNPLLDTTGVAPTIARLAVGLVVFPHSAQKVFGAFGGPGIAGAHSFMVAGGVPSALAWLAIAIEALSVVGLVLGLFTRVAAVGMIAIMIGAIASVHWPHGFFMNWTGTKAGEGFEFHILVIALCLVCLVLGGGFGSVDRALARRTRR